MVRGVGNPPEARNFLEVGSPAAEVQVEIRALQRLCAWMECPSDCLALRQNCYSAWPGLGGCGAARARWRRARHSGVGRAGVLGFWGGGGDGNGAQEDPRAPIKGKPGILGRCAPHGRGGHGRDLRAEETDRGTAQRDPPWVELLKGGRWAELDGGSTGAGGPQGSVVSGAESSARIVGGGEGRS